MELIFVSGPSGSGKTTLSSKFLSKIKYGIILSTDNYYKTGLLSKLLSKFVHGYFDRSISFNYRLFKRDFNFIVKNGISIYERSYNFKNKTIEKFLKETKNIKFLIVEGIFAKEFSRRIYDKKFFLLELQTNKEECMKRVVERDIKERGKKKEQAKNDFVKSWDIYYARLKNRSLQNNPRELIITKSTNIDHILKKIFNLKY
tara:strand:+ start:93 stop:698 length:606 start_codon:yes stop_codon:yes gene_type:complete